MGPRRKKVKKAVIGKFPLGGTISPSTWALIKQAMDEGKSMANLPLDNTSPISDSMGNPLGDPLALGENLTPEILSEIAPEGAKPGEPRNLGKEASDLLKGSASQFSLLGGISTGLANKPGFAPDVAGGTLGGSLSGLGAGLSMGGPLGGALGLAAGGLMGFMNSSEKRGEYESALERANRQRVKDRTVDPFMGVLYAEEGGIVPEDISAEDLSPVQTEEGEMAVLPSGILTYTKAKEKHEDMDDDDITDILPAGSLIFSNSLENKLDLTEDVLESVIGYGVAHYSEEGEPSEVESVEFEDVLKKNKEKSLTFAQVARNIKDTFTTVKDHKDVFNNITNIENMKARMPFLSKLMQLQDEKMGNNSIPTTQAVQVFGKGGKVKKYPDGGSIGGSGMTLEELIASAKSTLNKDVSNLEQENIDRTEADALLENRLRTNNVLANGIIGPMSYLMQNPQVRPAYVDTNLSGAMFRPGSNQATQGIAATGMQQATSLAQELIRQGVNPVDAISMTARDRQAATSQANDINYKKLASDEALDRAKYKFLSEARTTNEAADVKAYNDTTDNQNKIIAGLGSEGKTFFKDKSEIDNATNSWRTLRAKDYYEGISNAGSSGINLDSKMFVAGEQQKREAQREKQLQDFLDGMKKTGNTDGTGSSVVSDALIQPNVDSEGDTPQPFGHDNSFQQPDLSTSLPRPSDFKAGKNNPDQVKALQQELNKELAAKGLPLLNEDAKFGPKTEQALNDSITARIQNCVSNSGGSDSDICGCYNAHGMECPDDLLGSDPVELKELKN